MMGDPDEEAYYASMEAPDETEIDWFPDYRLGHDGYEEFICDLCGEPNESRTPHKQCHDEEQWLSEHGRFDDDLPF